MLLRAFKRGTTLKLLILSANVDDSGIYYLSISHICSSKATFRTYAPRFFHQPNPL